VDGHLSTFTWSYLVSRSEQDDDGNWWSQPAEFVRFAVGGGLEEP